MRMDLAVTGLLRFKLHACNLQFGRGLLKIIDLVAALTGDRSVQQLERGGNCALLDSPAWVVIVQGQGRSAIDLPSKRVRLGGSNENLTLLQRLHNRSGGRSTKKVVIHTVPL